MKELKIPTSIQAVSFQSKIVSSGAESCKSELNGTEVIIVTSW